MRYVSAVVSLTSVGVLLSCSGANGSGSDREMTAAIESAWNGPALGLELILTETARQTVLQLDAGLAPADAEAVLRQLDTGGAYGLKGAPKLMRCCRCRFAKLLASPT